VAAKCVAVLFDIDRHVHDYIDHARLGKAA
jgi:hypothetical protein